MELIDEVDSNIHVKAGFKKTDFGLIPYDWAIKSISEFETKVGSGKTPKGGEAVYIKEGIPFLRSQNIGWGFLKLEDLSFISDEIHSTFSGSEIQLDDVLLNITGASIGRSSIADERIVGGNVNQHVCIIRTNSKVVLPKFLNYVLLANIGQAQIDSYQAGGNREGLNFNQIKSIKIPLPPTVAEQKAIAKALSDVDTLISNLDKLITKKKAIKQGAMVQLLKSPEQGGKRVAGFDGEWQERALGEIVEIKKGQLITAETTVVGNIPVIAGGKQPAYYHNTANRFGRTITISASGASAGYVSLHNYPIFASDCSTIEEKKDYDLDFIYYTLISKQQEIYYSQTGGAQPHIHPVDLKPILIPSLELNEQQAIANVLNAMDLELKSLEKKKAKYQSIKQGMMQELLTGKTRLV